MCRPELIDSENPVFFVQESRHPIIFDTKNCFVTNDIEFGGVILLTGPNMGGKSTLLRQICLTCIIAQIGCYVPAKFCKMSIVDRIFTRIGGFDKILEGKSTFYIEMEDIASLTKYATKRSLAVIDELGRGTSTFDGAAIAYSVLKFIITHLKCRCLFTTHYHMILNDFVKKT